MKDKKSFVMMGDWTVLLSRLPELEAGRLIKAICAYQITGAVDVTDPVVEAWMSVIVPIMNENNEKHQETCLKRAEAGKNGAAKRWRADSKQIANDSNCHTNDSKTMANTWQTMPDSDSESDKEKETSPYGEEKKESAKRFKKPTLEEVREYCQQRGNSIEPQVFLDFYESVGWKVGTKPMKDWKACVRTWEQRRKERARSGTTNKFTAGIVKADYSDFNEEEWIAN
jgi:hypothetical protein